MARIATFILTTAAVALAGCSPEAANKAAPAAKNKRPPHCFFKDSETERWAVKVDGDEAVVTGRGFRSDSRYKVVLLEPKIAARVAVIRPSIAVNDTGFGAEGNWWDIETSIPAADVDTIEVRCGSRLIATLPVTPPTP